MNLNISARVAKQFRDVARRYDGRIGLCASAALLMFLEADPREQGNYINKVFQLDLSEQVDETLRAVKEEQARRVEEHERNESTKSRGTIKRGGR